MISSPIGSTVSATRTLIVATIAAYALVMMRSSDPAASAAIVTRYGANPNDFHWWQLVTSLFLHGGLAHLGFNMIGLAVFGPPLEERLGRGRFIIFYLACGAAASAAHVALSSAPAIGASGAVYGLLGAFAVIYPRARIGILLAPRPVPAPVLALVYLLIDILGAGGVGGRGVANLAHIGGLLCGVVAASTMLWLGWIRRDGSDILFVTRQWFRRRRARRVLNEPLRVSVNAPAPSDPNATRIMELRGEISALHGARNLQDAARRYAELLTLDPRATLPEQVHLDVANQLWAAGDARTAVAAWELHRLRYPRSARANEIDLMLALAYARRLGALDRAREILAALRPRVAGGPLSEATEQLAAEVGA